MSRIGWLDCSCGVSGDMLLGALHSLGALAALPELIASLAELGVSAASAPTTRHGIAAVSVTITAPTEQPSRGLQAVLDIVAKAEAPERVKERADAIFDNLARVEASVHGTSPDDVHFHEVGAVDSIVDVLAGCLGLHALGLDRLVVSPIALGGGTIGSAHGRLAVPTPAALGLLAGTGLVGHGGPIDVELATPTGVAILAEWADASGSMPPMQVSATGVGAGSRDLAEQANVVRLVVGEATATADDDDEWQTIEANVDDLDPRLWPGVLDQLLAAGAVDAWLTPILMKKGRPAHTVSALVEPTAREAVTRVLFAETSTIGVRTTVVGKHALDRSWLTVDIDGQSVRVKQASEQGQLRNLSPEFEDVANAAAALGLPVKQVLTRASAAAIHQLGG